MADEKPWVIPSDIPEYPTEKLVVTGSGGRRWESAPMPEGFFDGLLPPMLRVADEREPESEPDYEALGYPETTVRHPGCHTLDVWADRLLWAMADAGLDWRPTVDNE